MPNTALGRTNVAILTNKSGGALTQGDTVVIDLTTAASFTTTTTSGYVAGQLGVILEPNGIANNAAGLVAFDGYIPKINLSGSAGLGDLFKSHTVAGQSVRHAAPMVTGDFGIVLGTGTSPAALLFGKPHISSSGAVSTDTIFDAKGDLAVGTGADAAGKLTVGANGTRPEAASGETTGIKWSIPPGYEYDYVAFTAPVSPTATTEATANTIVTANPVLFDGSTVVMVGFFSPEARPDANSGRSMSFWLYDATGAGTASVGLIGFMRVRSSAAEESPVSLSARITPSGTTHTYSIRASVSAGTGVVSAGTGGSGVEFPGYIRIFKAN